VSGVISIRRSQTRSRDTDISDMECQTYTDRNDFLKSFFRRHLSRRSWCRASLIFQKYSELCSRSI